MRTTYRASVFACFYFGVLFVLLVGWCFFWSELPQTARIAGSAFLALFGVLGLPSLFARVTIDDSGIEQRFFTKRSVSWADIVSWQRRGSPDSDCPDTITIETRRGPFQLNGNCVFGKRLAEVEAELRRRVRSVA
jgi:hypothetical protein